MNTDTITQLVLLLDKYRDMAKNSNAYIKYEIAKEVVSDLEKLKESMKR
jgi:hypothetical protein